MKEETIFRNSKVTPFLKKLPCTSFFPIQQLSISGTPDFILCIAGQFVALELKSEFGIPSKLQMHNMDWIRRTGGRAIIAYPENWDSVKRILTKIAEGDML